jgi:hypothetical protein
MPGKCVPNRAFSLDSGETLISVREAASMLDLSKRSVYGYLARGKLTKKYIDERIMLSEEEVLAFELRAPGRPRENSPIWHLPPGRNPLYLMSIIVPLRPGCDALLDQSLPPDEQREQEIAALATDLAEVCDWESAHFHEGQTYAHAR